MTPQEDRWADWSECTECSLCLTRERPVGPRGRARLRIMFVGEAPGEMEVRYGRAFVGRSGKLLDEWLQYLGLTEDDVYITNTVKCRPPNNRDPSEAEIDACIQWLIEEVDALEPRLVVPLGRFAKEAVGRLRAAGLVSEQAYGLALKHPSWYLRQGGIGLIPTEELRFLRAKLDRVIGHDSS